MASSETAAYAIVIAITLASTAAGNGMNSNHAPPGSHGIATVNAATPAVIPGAAGPAGCGSRMARAHDEDDRELGQQRFEEPSGAEHFGHAAREHPEGREGDADRRPS